MADKLGLDPKAVTTMLKRMAEDSTAIRHALEAIVAATPAFADMAAKQAAERDQQARVAEADRLRDDFITKKIRKQYGSPNMQRQASHVKDWLEDSEHAAFCEADVARYKLER